MTEPEARLLAKEALQRAVVRKGHPRDCGDPIIEREIAKEILDAYEAGVTEGHKQAAGFAPME